MERNLHRKITTEETIAFDIASNLIVLRTLMEEMYNYSLFNA